MLCIINRISEGRIMYKTCIYIGRFQPAHKAHIDVIKKGLEIADNVSVLIGSSNLPRSVKNPWTFHERAKIISQHFTNEQLERIDYCRLPDDPYNHDNWIKNVKAYSDHKDTVLIGHYKDSSSYYIHHFPEWDLHHIDNIDDLNSTDIRNSYFENKSCLQGLLSDNEYYPLRDEYNYIKDYKRSWENVPYPVIFQTVDALVITLDSILLIKRKGVPGKGLWALPGGFVDENETLINACIRELREETGVNVDQRQLSKGVVFDSTERSERGRVISHVFRICLSNEEKTLHGDDASDSKWVKFSELRPDNMYSDHYFIIKATLKGELP